MPLVITPVMADGQVLQMAVAAFAQGLDVLQRGVGGRHVFAAHPAGHHAMHLAGHGTTVRSKPQQNQLVSVGW